MPRNSGNCRKLSKVSKRLQCALMNLVERLFKSASVLLSWRCVLTNLFIILHPRGSFAVRAEAKNYLLFLFH